MTQINDYDADSEELSKKNIDLETDSDVKQLVLKERTEGRSANSFLFETDTEKFVRSLAKRREQFSIF